MSGITLLRGEEMKMQLKPHVLSFFHLYVIFFLLLIWAYVIHDFFESDKFEEFPGYDFINGLSNSYRAYKRIYQKNKGNLIIKIICCPVTMVKKKIL